MYQVFAATQYWVKFSFSSFKRFKWLPLSNMVNQCICSQVVEYFQKGGPSYMSALFTPNKQSLIFKNFFKVSPWRYDREGDTIFFSVLDFCLFSLIYFDMLIIS